MQWFKKNWVCLLVNIIVILPAISILMLFRFDIMGDGQMISIVAPEGIPEAVKQMHKNMTVFTFPIKSTGEWAIRCLIACMTITPLFVLFGKNKILRYRKIFGLYAFGYALAHTLFFIADKSIVEIFAEINFILGLVSLVIMIALALSSNKWSMRTLGKNWKKLQRFTYAAAILAVLHLLLLGDGSWVLYASILLIGFILRIPKVKQYFVDIRANKSKNNALSTSIG